MTEYARQEIIGDHSLLHKVWRGHNGEWIFDGPEDKLSYLQCLNKTISKPNVQLHALCLMSNHSHEVYYIQKQKEFSEFVRKHHCGFAKFYNRKSDRRGPVSESRPKTIPITSDVHEIVSVLYIHANPVRAGIVQTMEELKNYQWSTHLLYGYGIYKDWMSSVVLPQWYLDFGSTDIERQHYYLYLFSQYLSMPEDQFLQQIQI